MTMYPDSLLRRVLQETKVIAAVGVSSNPIRPSYYVARYLSGQGYRVIPVNPGLAGQSLFGETVYENLSAIPSSIPVDMIDLFRRSEHVLPIVKEALSVIPSLRTVWMQIGVENAEAAGLAEEAGATVIQNRCPKIERQRLFGELRKAGFNTGVVSSKL